MRATLVIALVLVTFAFTAGVIESILEGEPPFRGSVSSGVLVLMLLLGWRNQRQSALTVQSLPRFRA
ncbi:MAG: hypothetical protein L0Y44_05530 [Phycisphaerales bacterium]|nr:hypothetical protein [Phycisphaerales bacterium]MCI0630099.1 hypothetical protein [Phycisphaerales bacterium]MCI0677225.1 hypothetical protein [Phycisphaerales bacterium]